MSENWVDFKEVKQAVSMETLLAHYQLDLRRVNATYFRGDCPLPTHSSESSRGSFTVNTEKNVWACQSKSCVEGRDGRKGGNILDFVFFMEGCENIRDAALKIQEWFNISASNERPADYVPSRERKRKSVEETGTTGSGKETRGKELVEPVADLESEEEVEIEVDSEEVKENQPLGFPLKSVNPSHEYIRKRGITLETAMYFGIGHFFGKGIMKNRVVIPIHNPCGQLVAYAGRAIDDDVKPKYRLPNGFRKSLEIFNLHRVLSYGFDGRVPVIVVEGFFDCLWLHQHCFENVVALMGSSMSRYQEKLIVENFKHVILLLDGDEAGCTAAREIASCLSSRLWVRIVDLPDDLQPDDISKQELYELLDF